MSTLNLANMFDRTSIPNGYPVLDDCRLRIMGIRGETRAVCVATSYCNIPLFAALLGAVMGAGTFPVRIVDNRRTHNVVCFRNRSCF